MITIKRTLDRENENAPIRDARILQGNFTNLEFRFNLADSGDSVTVTNSLLVKWLVTVKHIVSLSGGIGSYETLKRVIAKEGNI